MNKLCWIFLIIFMVPNFVQAYDKVYQFDMNEDIIISTTVYNITGKPCLDCSCVLNIYNPSPYETFINSTYNLNNNNNGIYTTGIINLTYNKNIYPITLVCNDSLKNYNGDDRNGIKVSETVFDYTAGIIAFVGVAIIFMIMSFWINKSFKSIRLVAFFSSLIFIALSLVLGYAIISQSPSPTGFKIIFGVGITSFVMITLIIIYFYMFEKIENTTEQLWNFGYRK